MIREHSKNQGHLAIIQKLQEAKERKLDREFEAIQAEEASRDNHFLEATSRMFRTVYVAAKKNIPFMSHPDLVRLQQLNGLNLGNHHFERTSATRMVETISKGMHRNIINHMLSISSPVSIILDGSSDSNGQHYLIVYFQAIEDNTPVMYFYKLIPTSTDESAEGLYTCLTDAFKNEDIYSVI